MKYNIRGKDLKVTKAIEEYLNEKLSKLEKYFKDHENITTNVLIKVRGHEQIIEVTIPTENFTIRAEEAKDDLYAAIDVLVDKLERQIKKNKTKLKKINKDQVREFNLSYSSDEEEDKETIVRRKKIDTKPMGEEEAILQMNMLGHDFYIYKDQEEGNIKVVYRRKDGNYGIIET